MNRGVVLLSGCVLVWLPRTTKNIGHGFSISGGDALGRGRKAQRWKVGRVESYHLERIDGLPLPLVLFGMAPYKSPPFGSWSICFRNSVFQNKLALEKVLYWGLSNVCNIGSNSRGPLLNFFMIHCYGVLVGPHFCTTPYGSLKHMIHFLMLLIHITHIYSCICNYMTWFSYYIPPFQAIKEEEEEEEVASKRSIA